MAKHFIFCVFTVIAPALSWAADPGFSCRVKSDVLKDYSSLINNAGCLITRNQGKDIEAMFVRSTARDGGGLAFPGGGPATKTNDLKHETTRGLASGVGFDYAEPAVCTAARETKEETGLNVIVADVFDISDYFILFHCKLLPTQIDRTAIHRDEVEGVEWHSVAKVLREFKKTPGILRFESNAPLLEKLLGSAFLPTRLEK